MSPVNLICILRQLIIYGLFLLYSFRFVLDVIISVPYRRHLVRLQPTNPRDTHADSHNDLSFANLRIWGDTFVAIIRSSICLSVHRLSTSCHHDLVLRTTNTHDNSDDHKSTACVCCAIPAALTHSPCDNRYLHHSSPSLCITYVWYIVPGAPPRNVSAEATSPTTIAVSWLPPPAERSNGRIVYYKLHFVEVGQSDNEATVTTLNQTDMVIDELKKWTAYKVWVLAGTTVGDGPISYPITVRTLEDGTYPPANHHWSPVDGD